MPVERTLYHLSEKPVGLMIPRIPKSDYEDQTIPRICFSTSIQGCLIGINEDQDISGKTFKVYSITTDDYYVPKLSEVADQHITDEVWIQFACEPDYLYDIKVTGKKGEHMEEINGDMFPVPIWDYQIAEKLFEDTRTVLVAKSKGKGEYKDTSRGKNRFERKKHSKIANAVKQYNTIDMNDLFKKDILQVNIPVIGETNNYEVTLKMEGVIAEIAKGIKNNQNKFEYKIIIQAISKIFNTANIYTKCTCPDHLYNFAHWNIVNNVSSDDTSKDPGPGKGIRNPKDDKGRGCKHILLVLANVDWIMKVASVINNYVHYAEEKLQKPFLNVIFPKLYGIPADEMVDKDLIDDDKFLNSSKGLIDAINAYGANRGKYKPGTNKNPVTGTGGRTKKDNKEEKPEAKPEDSETSDKTDKK
jgi:hypothetical protein